MILANSDFGVLEMFWSILIFFVFFLWIWQVIAVFGDIMRADDMSGWAKAVWAVGIIILPFLGVILYLIVNGDHMNQRGIDDARAADEARRAYIRDAAASGPSHAEQLSTLVELHERGKISDTEYAAAKASVLAS